MRVVVCVNRMPGPIGRCDGLRGESKIAEALEASIRYCGFKVDVDRMACLGKCAEGPNLRIAGNEFMTSLSTDDIPDLPNEFERCAGRDDQNALLYPGA